MGRAGVVAGVVRAVVAAGVGRAGARVEVTT